MLTIDEIKNIAFRKAGISGYRADDVDEFIDDVIATFEQMKAEKADLLRKMDILATKIEQYRSDEETVRNALLSSQKLADQAQKEAKDKATYIIKAAEKKSRKILTEAEMATEREKDKYEAVLSETAKLRKEMISLYKKHLALLDEFPTEEVAKAKREEMDEKYPFEPVDEIINSDDIDVEEEMIQSAEVAPIVRPVVKSEDVKPEQKNEKFDQLKFGDNYDVE
ncbi:MAG: DivIVA domain-containing protein [Ruminococcaceae bacterium]|nr:DivIVA domain-containing protein [Oscillospiraceae bacterium]